MSDTAYLQVKNAHIMPVVGAEDRPLEKENATGGVFDQNGNLIDGSLIARCYAMLQFLPDGSPGEEFNSEREDTQLLTPAKPVPPLKSISGNHIFAGYWFNHFGHFLLESLAKLWFIKSEPDTPLIWVSVDGKTEIQKWQQELIDLLGIQNKITIINYPVAVEELIIPENGYKVQTYCSKAQAQSLMVYPARAVRKNKKVWLSRSKMDSGRYLNDVYLEQTLSAAGWQIYHPQEYDLKAQLDFLSDAERIAGVAGSAFHTLSLIDGLKAKIDIFTRGRTFSRNFVTLADAVGLNQNHHHISGCLWSTFLPGFKANFVWLSLVKILRILDVHRPRVEPKPSPFTDNFNAILGKTQSRRLLQISRQHEGAFLSVTADRKVYVNGMLEWDMSPYENEQTRIFELTPDQYFLTGVSEGEMFDLIVLDDLDGETLRCAIALATRHSHLGTRWLLRYETGLEKFCSKHFPTIAMKIGEIEGRQYLYLEEKT